MSFEETAIGLGWLTDRERIASGPVDSSVE